MSKEKTNKTLILGIGNSSRRDDGLGWRLLDFLRTSGPPGIDLEYRYQLQVEDAELISRYPKVIFVDATVEAPEEGFYFRPCNSKPPDDLGSHALSPETVNFLCRSVFDKTPECHLLAIRGSQWQLQEGLSPMAERNLEKARDFFIEHLFAYI